MVVDGEPARLVLSEIMGPRGAEGQCVASPPAPRHQYTGHAAGLLGLADLLHRLHDRVLAPTPGLAVDRADGCVVSLPPPATAGWAASSTSAAARPPACWWKRAPSPASPMSISTMWAI
jgi:hypothetical protein